MATMYAYARHHTRTWSRPYAQVLAVKKLKILIKQGIRIINLLDAAIYFSQIISLLPHTNLTKRVRRPKGPKAISQRLHR